MKALLYALALCAASLNAADLSGKWTGNVQYEEDGEQRTISVVLELKQAASDVTGTVMTNEEGAFPIQEGKVAGDRFTFTVEHDGTPVRFALNVNGPEMKGEGVHGDEGTKIKMAVKREGSGTTSASVSGKWTGIADWGDGSQGIVFELKQDGDTVTGTASTEQGGPTKVEHGRYENGRFTFDSNPDDGPVKVELTVSGAKMTGTAVKMLNGSERYDVKLSLKREQ